MKNIIFAIITMVLPLILLALLGEAGLRTIHYANETLSGNSVKFFTLDPEMGWVGAANFKLEGELKDASGAAYEASIHSDEHGFRAFGDRQRSGAKKLLILGDSYTHAMQVSDHKTYYDILGKNLNLEVFALAVGGYGTLQQHMLLERYIDEIQPDLVLLQLCPNDVINNSFELETLSILNNNGMTRPYFEDGGKHYKMARKFPALRDFANNYSRLLYFILKKVDILSVRPGLSVEPVIEKEGMAFTPFARAIDTTDILVGKIRQRIPADIPLLAFATNHSFPYYEQFQIIAGNHGIPFIKGVSEALVAAEQEGVTTRAADGEHWNNAGHAIVAAQLQTSIEKLLH